MLVRFSLFSVVVSQLALVVRRILIDRSPQHSRKILLFGALIPVDLLTYVNPFPDCEGAANKEYDEDKGCKLDVAHNLLPRLLLVGGCKLRPAARV